MLTARQQLQRVQKATKAKKSEPVAATRTWPVSNAAPEGPAPITDRVQARPVPSTLKKTPARGEAYCRKATALVIQQKEMVATPKALEEALEHEKTPELAAELAAEAIERDPWAAQVS